MTYSWVQQFVARTFPDPEPELQCVRIYRAVIGLVVSAALLSTTVVGELARFTNLPEEIVSLISANMRHSYLWTAGAYDCSEWLKPDGKLNPDGLLEHVEIAFGEMTAADAEYPPDSMHVYNMFVTKMDEDSGFLS